MQIKKLQHFENIVYRVEKDDTLNSICQKFKTTPESIIFYHPNKELYEGELIIITKANKVIHVVKPLENIYTIMRKYNVSKEYIIQSNNLKTENLFIGQKIIL